MSDIFLRRLFTEAVAAVHPKALLKNSMRVVGNELRVEDGTEVATHDLSGGGRVFVVGFGKGVLPLAVEVERVLGAERISRGILSVPHGFPATDLAPDTRCGFEIRLFSPLMRYIIFMNAQARRARRRRRESARRGRP